MSLFDVISDLIGYGENTYQMDKIVYVTCAVLIVLIFWALVKMVDWIFHI